MSHHIHHGFDTRKVPALGRALFLALMMTIPIGAIPVPVYVGGPDMPTVGANTVKVPIYLSNFWSQGVSSVSVAMQWNAGELAYSRLILAGGFDLVNSDTAVAGNRTLSFTAQSQPWSYGSAKLGDLEFTVLAGGAFSSPVRFTGISVNADTTLQPMIPGFNILGGGSLTADVNLDGQLDLTDVTDGLQTIITTPNSSRPATLEFSRMQPVCAHDMSILARHILGITTTLPVGPVVPQQPPLRSNVQLTLSAPVSMGSNIYRYDITGVNTAGVISAEFTLQLNASVFQSVVGMTGNGREMLIQGTSGANNTYQIYMVSADSMPGNGVLAQIRIRHQSGNTNSAVTSLASAFLNEGALAGNFISRENGNTGLVNIFAGISPIKSALLTAAGIWPPRFDLGKTPALLLMVDAQGRILLRRNVSGGEWSPEISRPSSPLWLRVERRGQSEVIPIYPAKP